MKNEYSAGGIVYREINRKIEILMILDPYGIWAFPKGHIEKNEQKEAAAIREVSEEAGIKIDSLKIIKKVGTTDFWFTQKGEKIHKYLDLYLIEATNGDTLKPQTEEKIKKAKWIKLSQAMDKFGYNNGKDVLKKAIDYLKNKYGI